MKPTNLRRQLGSAPTQALLLWLLLVAALMWLQWTTLARFGHLPPGLGMMSPGAYVDLVRSGIDLGPWDGFRAALVALVLAALVTHEVRTGGSTRLLRWWWVSDRRACVLAAACAALLGRFLLAPGHLSWAGDASEHIVYTWLTMTAIGAGELPTWSYQLACGTPFLQFYGPAFFVLAGGLASLAGDLVAGLKVTLIAAHVVSGMAMWWWVRMATGRRDAALLASIGYVASVWHWQQVVVMGRLPVALVYALLPLPFAGLELARRRQRRLGAILTGGLCLGLLPFVHAGYAFWATALWLLYAGIRSAAVPRRRRPGVALAGVSMLGIALLVGASQTLPMWWEREATLLASGVDLAAAPDPGWRHLLAWSNFRFTLLPAASGPMHWNGGYLGLSLLGMAALSVTAFRSPRPGRRSLATATLLPLALCLALIAAYRWPWLQALGPVTAMASARFLVFVVLFLAAAAGCGYAAVTGRTPSRRWGRWLVALVLLDLGPTTFQHIYLSEEVSRQASSAELRQIRQTAKQGLDGDELPGYRFVATTAQLHRFAAISLLSYHSGVPAAQGLYLEAPRAQARLVRPWMKLATPLLDRLDGLRDLVGAPGADLVVTGIKLLNVGYAISNRGADDMMILRIDRPGPVVVAGRAEAFPAVDVERLWSSGDAEAMVAADPYLRRIWPSLETGARRAVFEVATLLRAMGLNPTQNTCETIMLARGPNVDLRTRPTVRVLSHRVWRDRVELRLAVTEDAIARLAYSHFPSQRVRVDGRDVAPMETAGGFLALRLQAGTHEIELQGGLSRLRRVLYGLDLLLLAAAVLLWRQASGAPRADVEPGRP